jgi:hypothetical protein
MPDIDRAEDRPHARLMAKAPRCRPARTSRATGVLSDAVGGAPHVIPGLRGHLGYDDTPVSRSRIPARLGDLSRSRQTVAPGYLHAPPAGDADRHAGGRRAHPGPLVAVDLQQRRPVHESGGSVMSYCCSRPRQPQPLHIGGWAARGHFLCVKAWISSVIGILIGQVEGERGGGPLTLGLDLSAEGERGGGARSPSAWGCLSGPGACPAAEPRSARAGPAPLSRAPGPGPSADLGRVFLAPGQSRSTGNARARRSC